MPKTKRMRIGGYVIVALEDQLTPVESMGELIENSDDANATKIVVQISPRSMTFIDNGDGCDDPMEIVTPSMSSSRHKKGKMGSKAIGAKQALACFGRVWNIHTVPRGRGVYHHLKVVWDDTSKDLPDCVETKEPKHCAPLEIRNGGTMIVVTGRQEGAAHFRFETLCTELERRYRPAISKGLEIVVKHFDGTKHQTRTLSNLAADLKKFAGPINELCGKVDKRSFTVRYGVLKEATKALTGCHFIYGPRVIGNRDYIGKQALTSRCYVDVTLGASWQKLLGTNKKWFRYNDLLIIELEKMLGDWLKKQQEAALDLKIRITTGKLADIFNAQQWWLERMVSGTYGVKPRVKREGPTQPPREKKYREEREVIRRRTRAVEGAGQFGATPGKGSALNFRIKTDDGLKTDLCAVAHNAGEVTVSFNSNNRRVKSLLAEGKTDGLYDMAAMAFAHHAVGNAEDFETLFENIRKLNNDYSLADDSAPNDIFFQLSNFFVDFGVDNEELLKSMKTIEMVADAA